MFKSLFCSSNNFARDERADSTVEYGVLLSMLVSAVFLGVEMVDRTSTVLAQEVTDNSTSLNISPDSHSAHLISLSNTALPVDATVNRWVPLAQVSVASVFVVVATGFVARNLFRRWGQPKDNDIHGLINSPNETDKENTLYVKRQELFRNLAGENFVDSLQNFTVDRLMATHITSVGPRTPTSQIRRLMTGKHIHHVLVCALDDTVLGVISDRDMLAKHGDTAQDIMTANPVCIPPDAAVLPTVTIMLERRISCLPVIDGEKVVGMITTTDIMLALQCLLQVLHIKLAPTTTPETANV